MSRKKSRKPARSWQTALGWGEHYIVLFDDLTNSRAFKSLKAHAIMAYLILLQEYKGDYTGDTVICPYETFLEKGFSNRRTIANALVELECMGFIDIEPGGLGHRPSRYTFSSRWRILQSNDKEFVKAVENLEEQKRRKKAAAINRAMLLEAYKEA